MIHWELCKNLNLTIRTKWYMHNPASVVENELLKLLRDFDVQTDHLISARRPNLKTIDKKERTCRIVNLTVPADHRVKLKESEKKDIYLELARDLKKKLWNMKLSFIPIVIGTLGTVTKG